MLNYLWFAMLILGIGAAISTDIIDQAENKFKNGESIAVEIVLDSNYQERDTHKMKGVMFVRSDNFNKFYGTEVENNFSENVQLTFDSEKNKNSVFFVVSDSTPEMWKEIAGASGKENDISAKLQAYSFSDSITIHGMLELETVNFTKMKDVTNAAINYASTAVTIAIGLIGIMALWLGIMKIAEDAGLIKIIARTVRPITKFLFPDVPQDHPAMGSMIMNISANMLGLGNAATPFGLKAMEELDTLNPEKGTATNSMITFLAINTAGLTLIPATAIAIRAASGSSDPTIIIGTSIFGALCATITGITLAKLFEKFPINFAEVGRKIKSSFKKFLILFGILALLTLLISFGAFAFVSSFFGNLDAGTFKTIIQIISTLAIPLIIFSFVLYGLIKKVKVYEMFVEGAKEGFNIAVKIIPYLVGMLVAIGIFRAGGMMDVLQSLLAYPAHLIGMPVEALPMALIRPLSGSGSTGVMAEIMAVHGPDSLIGIMVSTFFGSTETTFYVLAVYFGSVNIRKTRHALFVGLMADAAGILGATFIVNQLFG